MCRVVVQDHSQLGVLGMGGAQHMDECDELPAAMPALHHGVHDAAELVPHLPCPRAGACPHLREQLPGCYSSHEVHDLPAPLRGRLCHESSAAVVGPLLGTEQGDRAASRWMSSSSGAAMGFR